jgi:hypothetical protein
MMTRADASPFVFWWNQVTGPICREHCLGRQRTRTVWLAGSRNVLRFANPEPKRLTPRYASAAANVDDVGLVRSGDM